MYMRNPVPHSVGKYHHFPQDFVFGPKTRRAGSSRFPQRDETVRNNIALGIQLEPNIENHGASRCGAVLTRRSLYGVFEHQTALEGQNEEQKKETKTKR